MRWCFEKLQKVCPNGYILVHPVVYRPSCDGVLKNYKKCFLIDYILVNPVVYRPSCAWCYEKLQNMCSNWLYFSTPPWWIDLHAHGVLKNYKKCVVIDYILVHLVVDRLSPTSSPPWTQRLLAGTSWDTRHRRRRNGQKRRKRSSLLLGGRNSFSLLPH